MSEPRTKVTALSPSTIDLFWFGLGVNMACDVVQMTCKDCLTDKQKHDLLMALTKRYELFKQRADEMREAKDSSHDPFSP